MTIWTLARKELRLLLRDRLAALMLVVMPLLFILILGLLLGEAFGQKPDDRIRVMVLDLDRGPSETETPRSYLEPGKTWAQVVQDDLKDTAGIRIERLQTREEADRLIAEHKQAAIIVFHPTFSDRVQQCSFLTGGINPFYRDGVLLDRIDAELLHDDKQPAQSAVIEQVAQVSLLRVIMPYMIAKAFNKLAERPFVERLGERVRLPVPKGSEFLFRFKGIQLEEGKASLLDALRVAAPDDKALQEYLDKVGQGVQESLDKQFENYELRGGTWAKLTRSKDERTAEGIVAQYTDRDGAGLLKRGAARYQLLVPSYTVMFAFFLVLTVGWLFVSERRQGTLRRLQAAPLTRSEILLGKLLPCFLLSVLQGMLLLIAGKLLFGMRWGPERWTLMQQMFWLLPVVLTTSLAAMGLALLVASLAKTEIQVALYGAVPVLVLALVGGCVLPREMMPESMQGFTLWTPQGWALDAYRELLDPNPDSIPNLQIVARACSVLAAFGTFFVALAWWLLPLD